MKNFFPRDHYHLKIKFLKSIQSMPGLNKLANINGTMRIIVLTLFLITLCMESTSAQYNQTIRTARPGASIGPFTVGKGIFQFQSGVDYYGSKSSDLKVNGFVSNTVMRLGLTETFEISTLIDYRNESVTQEGSEISKQGVSAMDVGMRYHILDGHGLVPNICFQIRFRMPVLGEDYEIDDMAPRVVVALNQFLTDNLVLTSNWGAVWNGVTSSPNGTYTINLAFPITKKLGSFVETFGTYGHGNFNTNFDTGLGLLLTNDLQLDLYGGYGSNSGVKDYFISMGVSVRTKRNEQK